ncbi:MAG TPA: AzlC family ABC transporter permease [Acidimicrobiia bacterium]|jgi:4-azaleucine resistance transporter AzlC|nr:AzlC family ABC transporter permease [Acidimicrobiia bacterium]
MPSTTDVSNSPRSAFDDGVRSVVPLLVGVVPFGLILGVAAGNAAMGVGLAWSTSVIIFGGAAQLVTIELSNGGAAAAVIVATALVVNARHLMYSAALAEPFRDFPTGWRYGLPYLMTDQAFAVSITRYATTSDPVYRRWFYFGAGMGLWIPWQVTTATGALAGALIPESWSLDFAIPLVFMVLIIPALDRKPGIAAAIVGGVVAVTARDVPYRLGLIIAALAGIAAGVIAERRYAR